MKPPSEQIGQLLKKIWQTKDVEMTCPECLDELDKYTQKILDEKPIQGVLVSVGEHLELCHCCLDQFKLILATLEATERS